MEATSTTQQRQSGAALLMIMLAVIVATSTVLLVNLDRDALNTRQLRQTQATLADARRALLDFAVTNPDRVPGAANALPCPDIDASGGFPDGVAHTTACAASGVSVIGRLPWRTLGLPALKDTASACLWYVVSGTYKDAGPDTAALINTDNNGQLQLFDIETSTISHGTKPDDRPIAMVIAAMQPLATQSRPGISPASECVTAASAANYLDTDSGSGISNASLGGIADALDMLGVVSGSRNNHNDRIVTISRADVERRITSRKDFLADMRSLGLAVAACIANYGNTNPGGSNDKRLPWPASVTLSDYRPNANYTDADTGFFSGRLADIANDSNITTGNSVARVLSDCDSGAVPQWTATQMARWQNWKDHFFYAVGEAYSPNGATPSSCGNCLTVNGAGQYAATLLFANTRLGAQQRNAPPTDTDTKGDAGNYLEGINASNIPSFNPVADYESGPASLTFNDLLFCIDEQLIVSEC